MKQRTREWQVKTGQAKASDDGISISAECLTGEGSMYIESRMYVHTENVVRRK